MLMHVIVLGLFINVHGMGRPVLSDSVFISQETSRLKDKLSGVGLMENVTKKNEMGCARRCSRTAGCTSFFYNKNTEACQLHGEALNAATAGLYSESPGYRHYNMKEKGQWQYIFGARNGTGEFVYETWKNRSYICTDPQCLIYKNEVVRKWNDLNIVKVRVVLNVGSDRVAWVEFNGLNSDALNWFSKKRLTGSTWKDIQKKTHNVFSIDASVPYRRFYISHYWINCTEDKQWLVVSEKDPSIHCDWDKHGHYPQFQFAKGTEVSGVNNMGLAEWFKIFIQEQ